MAWPFSVIDRKAPRMANFTGPDSPAFKPWRTPKTSTFSLQFLETSIEIYRDYPFSDFLSICAGGVPAVCRRCAGNWRFRLLTSDISDWSRCLAYKNNINNINNIIYTSADWEVAWLWPKINTVTRARGPSSSWSESRAYPTSKTSKTRAELINAPYCDTSSSTRNSNETRPCPEKL